MTKKALLLLSASLILTAAGCSDGSSTSSPQTCDEATKLSADCTCNESTGLWENCGGSETCLCNDGTTPCPGGDKANCPQDTCKCDDGSDCPSGDKANCPQNACKCDDGSDCPSGDKANCPQNACKCDDGTDCPNGDKANCVADACKCDDGTDCPSGDKANCPADTCKCDDGSDCPSGDKANCPQNACKCDDGSDCPDGDKANCPADTCKCDDGSDCPSGDKANCPAETCKCDDGTDCPNGDKANCIAASACKQTQPDAACVCNEDAGKWDCSAKCTDAKPADDCTCAEEAGSWGWKCASNCTTEQPAADCICQDNGSWSCNCNNNTLFPRQTCDCDNATGQWIDSTCTFSCDSDPSNAKPGTCQCNTKTGVVENCKYNCQDSEMPHNAKSCECDDTNGKWKTDTCKYNCPEKPANATSCDCDESTGTLINCQFTCDSEPDNVVTGSCTCDSTTGELTGCVYQACNNSDKPTEHVKSCECVEGVWECTYNCLDAKPEGAVVDTCVCQSNGVWACEINLCQDKTLLVGQVCDPTNGNVGYNTEPKLKVSVDELSISENGGVANVKVWLEDAQPASDVPLSFYASGSSRINIEKPSVGDKIPAAQWNTGVTYKVTGKNNDVVDGDIYIEFTVTTKGAGLFYNLSNFSTGTTVTDDDQPSIILSCDGTDLYPPKNSSMAYYNKPDDPTSLKCNVSLAMKPKSNVTVKITPELVKSETCGSATSNCTKVTPYFGETLSQAQEAVKKDISYSFTKENYSTPKVFYVVIEQTAKTAASNTPEIYNIVAQSSTAGYVAEQKLPINAHVMQRYIVFTFFNAPQQAFLPKGRYRLHAIGASGGLPASAGSNYKFMEVSCDTDTGKASFKYKNHGGAGAYIYGTLKLTSSETIYVYTGAAGKVCESSNGSLSYNGGGRGRAGGKDRRGVNGGGATDFCIGHTDCATYDKHWPYRILVAGGGGGGSDWSEDGSTPNVDTEYKHGTGGSAKSISFEKGSGFQTGGNGLHYGAEKNSDGRYYAPSGYSIYSSSNFGKGEDAEAHCNDDNSRRNGGGGGGWYGGLTGGSGAFQTCAKDTGGSAGSSYAFNGTKNGNGAHDGETYRLTNVGGIDGGTSCNVFKYIGNGWGREITSGQMLGVDHGIAFIEVLEPL